MHLSKLGPYLRPYWKHCVSGPLFKLAEAVLELYLPLLMAKVIDEGVGKNDTGYVLRMGGIMLGIVTVGLLCALVCQYVASVTSQGFGTGLRNAVFAKIGTLSHAELDRFGTPSLINRVTGDVNQLQYAVAMLIRLVIRAPFLCIGGIIMAMTIDLKLSLVIIVAIPLFVVVITLVMRKTIKLHRQVQKKLDRLTLVLRENLSGIRVIRAFARTGEEQERFDEATDDHTRTAIRVGRLSAMLNPATQLIMNAAILAIVWFGGWRVEAGGMTTRRNHRFYQLCQPDPAGADGGGEPGHHLYQGLRLGRPCAGGAGNRALDPRGGAGSGRKSGQRQRWNSDRWIFPTAAVKMHSAASPLRRRAGRRWASSAVPVRASPR